MSLLLSFLSGHEGSYMDRLTEPIVITFYPLFSSRISCKETSGSPAMECVVQATLRTT